MRNVFIKPRDIEGSPAIVRDPSSGKPLDPAGENKPADQFWTRRLAQGDVVDAAPKSVTSAKTDPAPRK